MKTLLWYFPFGTLRGTVLSYSLSAIYGTLTVFRSVTEIIKHRQTFFSVKRRPQAPQCLTDGKLGEHNYLKLSNLKLHYVSKGDKNRELMLFLHGFPESWYSWRNQLTEFSRDYYAVAIDMRGYGDSDKPAGVSNYSIDKLVNDVREAIAAFGKDSCVLVAHDWGGVVAWSVAAQYPELVRKLVILNAPTIESWLTLISTNWKQFFMSWYVFFFNLPLIAEIRIRANDLKFFDIIWKKVANSEEIEAYKYYYSRTSDSITAPLNYYRALQRGYGYQYYNEKIRAKRITSPTLVVWGKKDTALLPSLADDSCRYCDDYTIKVIDDCSHWTPFDKPVLVNQYMREFLK